MNNNKKEKELFSRVVQPYLDKGGNLEPIELSVQDWLNNNKEEKKLFSHVVQSYLEQKGNLDPIELSVRYWLKCYEDDEEWYRSYPYVLNYIYKNKRFYSGNIDFLYSIFTKWLIYAMKKPKVAIKTISETIRNSFNDFDDINIVSERVFESFEEYLLEYNIQNDNNDIEKYFLVCSKYLKFIKCSTPLIEKFMKELPLLESFIDVSTCKKFYRKVVDIKYDKLDILNKLKLYPSLNIFYFKEYFDLGNDFRYVKDIYREYVKQCLKPDVSATFLSKYSYINQYLNSIEREMKIDKIIKDIIKNNLKRKNPTRQFIFSYIKSERNFFEIKSLLNEFIKNGGNEYVNLFETAITNYLENNPKEEYHQLFLELLENNKEVL